MPARQRPSSPSPSPIGILQHPPNPYRDPSPSPSRSRARSPAASPLPANYSTTPAGSPAPAPVPAPARSPSPSPSRARFLPPFLRPRSPGAAALDASSAAAAAAAAAAVAAAALSPAGAAPVPGPGSHPLTARSLKALRRGQRVIGASFPNASASLTAAAAPPRSPKSPAAAAPALASATHSAQDSVFTRQQQQQQSRSFASDAATSTAVLVAPPHTPYATPPPSAVRRRWLAVPSFKSGTPTSASASQAQAQAQAPIPAQPPASAPLAPLSTTPAGSPLEAARYAQRTPSPTSATASASGRSFFRSRSRSRERSPSPSPSPQEQRAQRAPSPAPAPAPSPAPLTPRAQLTTPTASPPRKEVRILAPVSRSPSPSLSPSASRSPSPPPSERRSYSPDFAEQTREEHRNKGTAARHRLAALRAQQASMSMGAIRQPGGALAGRDEYTAYGIDAHAHTLAPSHARSLSYSHTSSYGQRDSLHRTVSDASTHTATSRHSRGSSASTLVGEHAYGHGLGKAGGPYGTQAQPQQQSRGWLSGLGFGGKASKNAALGENVGVIPPVQEELGANGRAAPASAVQRRATLLGHESGALPPASASHRQGQPGTGIAAYGSRATEGFFRQLADVSDTITLVEEQVEALGLAHDKSLESAAEASRHQAEQEVTHAQSLSRSLLKACHAKLLTLLRGAQQLPPAAPERYTQLAQIEACQARLKGTLHRYYELEQHYRARYRQRAERQYRVVNPYATADEVAAVLHDGAHGQALFQDAMRSCTRVGEARAALREVQERHEDIRKIERTLAGLAALFEDVDMLLHDHDRHVTAALDNSQMSKEAMKEAEVYLAEGAEHARRARRRRWCLFISVVVLLLAIAAAIAASICAGGRCTPHHEKAEPKATPLLAQDHLKLGAHLAHPAKNKDAFGHLFDHHKGGPYNFAAPSGKANHAVADKAAAAHDGKKAPPAAKIAAPAVPAKTNAKEDAKKDPAADSYEEYGADPPAKAAKASKPKAKAPAAPQAAAAPAAAPAAATKAKGAAASKHAAPKPPVDDGADLYEEFRRRGYAEQPVGAVSAQELLQLQAMGKRSVGEMILDMLY